MQRFLQEGNVVLYRRLRNPTTGETERRMIIKLLVEQMDKLKMSKNEDQQHTLRCHTDAARWEETCEAP